MVVQFIAKRIAWLKTDSLTSGRVGKDWGDAVSCSRHAKRGGYYQALTTITSLEENHESSPIVSLPPWCWPDAGHCATKSVADGVPGDGSFLLTSRGDGRKLSCGLRRSDRWDLISESDRGCFVPETLPFKDRAWQFLATAFTAWAWRRRQCVPSLNILRVHRHLISQAHRVAGGDGVDTSGIRESGSTMDIDCRDDQFLRHPPADSRERTVFSSRQLT